jgi:hypothetical protein
MIYKYGYVDKHQEIMKTGAVLLSFSLIETSKGFAMKTNLSPGHITCQENRTKKKIQSLKITDYGVLNCVKLLFWTLSIKTTSAQVRHPADD